MRRNKLTENQRELLSETVVDVGKLVFGALALAQTLSDKPLNFYLFAFGLLYLVASVAIGISIAVSKNASENTYLHLQIKQLNEKQRKLLVETIVDIGKLVFATLVLAQMFSDKPLNFYLLAFGLLYLVGSIVIGISISESRVERNKQWKPVSSF
jgi:uncharacterized membrane protein